MAHPGGFEPPTLGFEGLYSLSLCPVKLMVCYNNNLCYSIFIRVY